MSDTVLFLYMDTLIKSSTLGNIYHYYPHFTEKEEERLN